MELKIRDLTKRLSALLAHVRFLPRMNEHMVPQIALLVETFATNVTHKILLQRVDLHVRLQCRRSVERFTAVLTFVRFIACVDDLVTAECA